ncbi:MAG: restriction endonuclease, partial [Allobaculum sp.]|nr:restriction endonuclease [Allobaculum sp.]
FIAYPREGHTQTFIYIGNFTTKSEALNLLKYLKTKFLISLIGTLKRTQHNSKIVWTNVPLQDFTSSSDIDWLRSIEEIDQQLYTKYGLSSEEIEFIETHVKEMI